MQEKKLSILIPTLHKRQKLYARLKKQLAPQLNSDVEVIDLIDDGAKSTGQKRNELIFNAKGQYIVFVDDDDNLHKDYVKDILKAIESQPDVITFNGWMTTNGKSHVDFEIKLGNPYIAKDGKYLRFPNHLCPIKKEIALKVKFPNKYQGEDYEWACGIQKYLKTSVHIDKQLYHYDFITKK